MAFTTLTMATDTQIFLQDDDPSAVSRKQDHIVLAFQSQIKETDARFYYEPLLSAHPNNKTFSSFSFLGKTQRVPLWVSSMTGGTGMAGRINHNLAQACKDFGFGMGLGSCRSLLHSDDHLQDFNVRSIMGNDLPLFANLGVAQLEQLIDNQEYDIIKRMIDKLHADGLIIHVNPMQEWLQPEGDRFRRPPIQTIETILEHLDMPIIVKEVGQGFGKESLRALLQLPIAALDFAAAGGTNFAKLELLRSDTEKQSIFNELAYVGHTAAEMVDFTNQLLLELGDKVRCHEVIISGGIQSFLDGHYLTEKLNMSAVYGQASSFLKYAQGDYSNLYDYIQAQVDGLACAKTFLRIR